MSEAAPHVSGHGPSTNGEPTDFRALLEQVPQNYLALLPDAPRFTIVGASDRYLSSTLTRRDEIVGRGLFDVFPDANPDNLDRSGVPNLRASLETVLRTRAQHFMPTQRYDVQAPDKSWSVRYWAPCNTLVLGPNGEVRYILHQVDDVTDRVLEREAEASDRRAFEQLVHALEVERARLQEVFRRAPSFIVAFRGRKMVYDFVNEAYYQLVGHREIIGKPLLEAIPEIRGQGFDAILERVFDTGEPWVGRESPVQLQRTPGSALETRYLDMVFQPMVQADGTRTGVIVHGSDITAQVLARREVEHLLGESEQARAEAELARREAEAANRAKSEFLAVMSHELRTPLNAIGGYTELLELGIRGPITKEQRDDLSRIQQSQRHLLGLINGVLNYARVEAGAVNYSLESVALGAILASCEALIVPQAQSRGLSVAVSQVDDGMRVFADREKLQQIVLNLLSNAVKFTEPGGRISVDCAVATPKGRPMVEIRVTDTGIGIPRDQLARVFEPFVQIDAKLTRTHQGTGLGLAISRDLARGMGGDITAESAVGVGSVFTLSLPEARD